MTLPYDEIHVEDLEVFAHHGVFPEENRLGQKFVISLVLYVDTRPAGTARAHSTDTEPVPAPTSHTVWWFCSRSLLTARVRTSSLVMGASPRRNSSSGMPGEL